MGDSIREVRKRIPHSERYRSFQGLRYRPKDGQGAQDLPASIRSAQEAHCHAEGLTWYSSALRICNDNDLIKQALRDSAHTISPAGTECLAKGRNEGPLPQKRYSDKRVRHPRQGHVHISTLGMPHGHSKHRPALEMIQILSADNMRQGK